MQAMQLESSVVNILQKYDYMIFLYVIFLWLVSIFIYTDFVCKFVKIILNKFNAIQHFIAVTIYK